MEDHSERFFGLSMLRWRQEVSVKIGVGRHGSRWGWKWMLIRWTPKALMFRTFARFTKWGIRLMAWGVRMALRRGLHAMTPRPVRRWV